LQGLMIDDDFERGLAHQLVDIPVDERTFEDPFVGVDAFRDDNFWALPASFATAPPPSDSKVTNSIGHSTERGVPFPDQFIAASIGKVGNVKTDWYMGSAAKRTIQNSIVAKKMQVLSQPLAATATGHTQRKSLNLAL
jgi:hypothetical protein